jgi:uncharacterized protein (TIGR03089 family)
VPRLFPDQLRQRARSRGADPLLTYYDLGTGERTELSATSFLNWVDKTSNLLVDELGLTPGAVVELRLAEGAPGHWVTLVLEAAAWQVGAVIRATGTEADDAADLLVLGADWQRHDRSGAAAVLACSLHPLGLGFSTALPADVLDFSPEVRGQSDFHSPEPRSAAEPAWLDDERALSQGDLVAVGADRSAAARRLVRVDRPWPTVRDGLVVPVLTGGSAVLVVGEDQERLARIVETERADADPST